MDAKSTFESAQALLGDSCLSEGSRFRAVVKRFLKAHDVAPTLVEAVVQFYIESGIHESSEECDDFPLESIVTANGIFETVHFCHPDLESGLNS